MFGYAAAFLGCVLLYSSRVWCPYNAMSVAGRASGECHFTWYEAALVAAWVSPKISALRR